MTIGFLPALGGGIRALAETGQLSRLVDGYMRPYADAFGEVVYFSYLPESLAEFSNDRTLLERVSVLAPPRPVPRGRRAVIMAGAHAAAFRRCRALRVFQITGVIPALLARSRFGVPYVTTYGFWYAQLSRRGPKRLLKSVVERLGLRHAAAVIATTEALRARAARVARRVELIPNGVDTCRFTPPVREGGRAAREPHQVLYVGRLSKEKNLSALVRAAASLRGRLPLRLVLVGDGPLRESLAVEARDAGVAIDFPGVVDQRRLPQLYAAADAFVLASFTEGHPKVLIEAMSAGLPCVASDCDGNRSLVTPERTGLLFDPNRPADLAACLERVLTDHALAESLGRAARELVVAQYDLGRRVQQEIAVLKSVART